MIQITVKRENSRITDMKITGHANAGDYGHDLVCAIVSGIATGLANAVDELLQEDNIILDEGYAQIHIDHPSEKSDLVMNTGLIELRTAEAVNKDYLKITEV